MAVDDIPETGLHREIEAPASVLAGVAALADVRELSGLSATVDVTRKGTGESVRVHVAGRVRARVGQTCVVSLEPVETDVDEPIDVTFAAAEAAIAAEDEERRRKPKDDPPEPLVGGTVNLGAIATEFLILGIDPYPRKADVEFTPPKVESDAPHPFAALEALKKKGPGGGQS